MKKAITVNSGGEVFGFFIHDVKEVVKCPRIFPVPKAPEYVKGIATLRGDCLPIISLSKILWNRDEDGEKVLIGQINGELVGFLVAEVNKVIEVSDEDLKRPSSVLSKGIKKKYVSAVYTDNGELITFLQMKKLVNAGGSKKEKKAISDSSKQKASSEVQQDVDRGESVLIFDAGGDVYGIGVSDVKEIVEYPARVVPAPSAPCHVLGLFSIRGKVIPLISIKRFLGSEAESARGRVIIIEKAGVEVGLEADLAREIRKVKREEVVPPPSSLNVQQKKILKGIIKLDGGKRLVHFLDPEPFIELEGMVSNEESMEEEEMKTQGQRKMFVWFSLASDAMAIPIEVVKEAVNVDKIVPVPRAPKFVEGVMNLRGQVLPIISLAELLGSEVERNECKRVIVTYLDGAEAGLLVKEIKGILRVGEADVSPLSEVAKEAAQVFSGAIRRDDDLILVLNTEALLSEIDKEKLRELTAD